MSKRRNLIANFILLTLSLAVAFVIAEFLYRRALFSKLPYPETLLWDKRISPDYRPSCEADYYKLN